MEVFSQFFLELKQRYQELRPFTEKDSASESLRAVLETLSEEDLQVMSLLIREEEFARLYGVPSLMGHPTESSILRLYHRLQRSSFRRTFDKSWTKILQIMGRFESRLQGPLEILKSSSHICDRSDLKRLESLIQNTRRRQIILTRLQNG